MEHNPYAAPTANLVDKTPEMAEMERIRNDHLKHESNIKGIGGLFVLGSILVVVGGLSALVGSLQSEGTLDPFALGVGVLFLLLGIIQGAVGVGLYRYRSSARIPGAILSGISMINIPIGTLIGGFFLYTLVSEKGRYVFTPEYQQIMAATPHVKMKTSLFSKIILVLLIVIIAGLIAGLALG